VVQEVVVLMEVVQRVELMLEVVWERNMGN
jgi:hypothetical protein